MLGCVLVHCVLDTECYHNYFLATFIFEDGRILEYEKIDDVVTLGDIGAIARLLLQERTTLVTFNGWRYDMPLLSMAVMGASNGLLKEASDRIIKANAFPWELERKYHFTTLQVDHIDIINLCPLFQSLKLYSARIGCAELQDLPFDPADTITPDNAVELRAYCVKDCNNTWKLFINLWDQIQLRIKLGHQYNQDLRSKSDAQIAETVIKSEFERITQTKLIKPIDKGDLPKQVTYAPPEFISFQTKELKWLLFDFENETYYLDAAGKPIKPESHKSRTVEIDGNDYTVGLGGLHAKNKSESYFSTDEYEYIDIDVTSYYPRAILNCGYEPPHMGRIFTRIYSGIVNQRVEAKQAGDKVTAATLKITANGTFGKLGSRYSAIYAPQLMLGTTLTGQLSLLMLIETMALRGIQCVSANTDGMTLKVAPKQLITMNGIIMDWEIKTGFDMEYTHYKSIHYRDVNNYFALTTDGEIKAKGIFKAPDLSKNPTTPIVAKAVIAHVLFGEPIRKVIERGNVQDYLAVRTVKGGAAKDGEYLGKAVRWYYSKNTDTAIHYISNGNMVAKSQGGMPMMDLVDEIPDDLDYDWYFDEAIETIKLIGLEYIAWL